ncbi:cation-transporting P-type ATPase [Ensifer sp. B1-9]|uniref:cation-transporting P-type ATPase n=1 Tax=Ensifer sp. B1-9 TaxID=3141455 RepID=UPI003D206ED3
MRHPLHTGADLVPNIGLQPRAGGDFRPGFWTKSAPELMRLLSTPPNGLSSAQVRARQKRYGPNTLEARATAKALRTFVAQFRSPLVLVLIVAAAIAMFVGDTQDAVIIWLIVLFTCILSFVQEYRASGAMERLKRTVARTATVLRGSLEGADGRPRERPVCGDVGEERIRESVGREHRQGN